ncbi:hypothetical protein [Streptomyces spirodelae]|uniref:Uncharacterized protein n=1 Tax=Streptomyces spirodelae TaxID=2812904 RepID=A0ABS3WLK3_9ACTN|nr:hypothetical protein [Streptomyces spirodelae]MBO8183986.1 hypothetical protein [Streptomyces spirodelae]
MRYATALRKLLESYRGHDADVTQATGGNLAGAGFADARLARSPSHSSHLPQPEDARPRLA